MSRAKNVTNYLLAGDPLEPSADDLIAQVKQIAVGGKVPIGGWRVLSGNTRYSQIGRVVQRYEIERAD